MKISLFFHYLFCSFTALIFTACGSSSGDDAPLHLMTEDYYPYNYQEDGQLKGSSVEIVRELLGRLGEAEQIEVLDWQSAIEALETEPNAALFTTALTPERKDKFKWVGPIGRIDWALFARNDSIPAFHALSEAKEYSIAVEEDYPMHERLTAEGHTAITVFPSANEALSAFFDNQVDLIASSSRTLYAYQEKHGLGSLPVRKVYDIKTELLYIAFSKKVSDARVRAWQDALDQMKDERVFAEIHQRYFPHSRPPEKLQLYTEQYPPITYQDSEGRITGGATEIVRLIMNRLGVRDNIILTNWDNAYNLAVLNPRVVLFSTERTNKREDLFHWVGPIGRNSAHFYTPSSSGVSIESIEEAKALSAVGTCSSWFTEQMLKDEGFENLISVSDPAELVKMLAEGEIEATVFTDITMGDIVRNAGYQPEEFAKQVQLTSSDFYIAISKDTNEALVSAWQKALEAIIEDGSFSESYHAWYPQAANPHEGE